MTHFTDTVLEPALWFLADWSLRWAVLISFLAIGLWVLRPRRAATRSLVCWGVLLAGLCLPAVPRWGSGWTLPGSRPSAPVAVSERRTVHPEGVHAPSPEPVAPLDVVEQRADVLPAVEPPDPLPPEEPLGTRRAIVFALATLWLTGVFVLLIRWLGGRLVLERMRRAAQPVGAESGQVFEACRAQLGLRRRVVLAAHPAVHSPIALGLFHPTILVPPAWPELPGPVQRGSLLHELAHLARYDERSALLFEFVRMAFFFHPLVHWLLSRLECERELLCDEAVLAQGIDARDYARMLLEFARQSGRLLPAAFGGQAHPLGIGQRRTVKIRIHKLLEENMVRWRSPLPFGKALVLGTVVLGLAVVVGSFGIQAVEAEAGAEEPVATEPGTSAPGDELLPFRIQPFHVLKIKVSGVIPTEPIDGLYLVEPEGTVHLGPSCGRVRLGSLTLDEANGALEQLLRMSYADPHVSVTLAGWVTKWQGDATRKAPYRIKPLHLLKIRAMEVIPAEPIDGVHVVQPDGKVDLGPSYGKVAVQGMTLDQATAAVQQHLRTRFKDPKVAVTMAGWEKDWHNLADEAAPPGDQKPALPARARETLRYDGKTFREWRNELATELKPELRIEGIKALSMFGAKGYGEEAARAILAEMRGYDLANRDNDDSKVIEAASRAMAKIGPPAVRVLLEALKSQRTHDRIFAYEALGGMRQDTKATIPVLLEMTSKDVDPYGRQLALDTLQRIDSSGEVFHRALALALKDENRDNRMHAVTLAGPPEQRFGGRARPSQVLKVDVPVLLDALKDKDPDVRRYAVGALLRYRGYARSVGPGFSGFPRDREPDIRQSIVRYMQEIGPEAQDLVPVLISALEDEDAAIRLSAVKALGKIGPGAKAAIRMLATLAANVENDPRLRQDTELREAISDAVEKIRQSK